MVSPFFVRPAGRVAFTPSIQLWWLIREWRVPVLLQTLLWNRSRMAEGAGLPRVSKRVWAKSSDEQKLLSAPSCTENTTRPLLKSDLLIIVESGLSALTMTQTEKSMKGRRAPPARFINVIYPPA